MHPCGRPARHVVHAGQHDERREHRIPASPQIGRRGAQRGDDCFRDRLPFHWHHPAEMKSAPCGALSYQQEPFDIRVKLSISNCCHTEGLPWPRLPLGRNGHSGTTLSPVSSSPSPSRGSLCRSQRRRPYRKPPSTTPWRSSRRTRWCGTRPSELRTARSSWPSWPTGPLTSSTPASWATTLPATLPPP